jgi:hypothetical protein
MGELDQTHVVPDGNFAQESCDPEGDIMKHYAKYGWALGAALLLGLSACQKNETAEGTAEKAGEQVDQAASKAAEQLNKAAEAAGAGLAKAGDKLKGAAQNAENKSEQSSASGASGTAASDGSSGQPAQVAPGGTEQK